MVPIFPTLMKRALPVPSPKHILSALTALSLAGCASDEVIEDGGVVVTRSACPAVAIPASTGDVTLFDPPSSRDARAIDIVAYVTNVRSQCSDNGGFITTTATFDVHAQRRNASGTRQVVLPTFTTVIQGGTSIVAKRTSRVALNFTDGQLRASTSSASTTRVSQSATTLPEAVRRKLTRRRKSGDVDAAVDPMTDPEVRAAVSRASFEMLVGFQLTPEQLAYNATR